MKFRLLFCLAVICGTMFFIADAAAQVVAGTIERQRGDATRIVAGDAFPLAPQGWVYVGDTITTGRDARVIIRFNDSSTLTLGENANIDIDELVYDPANAAGGRQALKFTQGVFQFVSGAISAADHANVAITTRVATIGIRGTRFVAGELTVGMPPGEPHFGVQIYDGAVEVTSPAGAVTLNQPGQGTFLPLTRVAAPTPVRQWTAEEAAEARAALAF
jgi:hypothetical protein